MFLRRKVFSVICLSFFFLFRGDRVATEIQDYLRKGEEYYRARDYKNSVIQFKSALTMNPSSKRALLGFARSSFVMGEKKDAFESYKRILELDPKNRDASLGLAIYHVGLEKFDEALKILNPILEGDPYDPDALVALSQIYLSTGKKELALKKLEEAKRKTAQNKEFLLMLANAYTATGKFSSAEEIILGLLIEYPNFPEAYFEKANLKVRQASLENYENRIKLIEETYLILKNALSLDAFYPEARKLFVRVCIYLKKYDEAKNVLELLVKDFRKDFDLGYLYIYMLEKNGENPRAEDEFKRILTGNELDDISRAYAEEFSVRYLKENSHLRSVLGEYRMEMMRFDKRNFIFVDPNYNLMRAKILIPQKTNVRSELLDYYLNKGYSKEFLNLLIKIRNDDPADFKIQNRLEKAIKKQKESISYIEGLVLLETNGIKENFERSSPEIFLFDVFPEEFLDYRPNAAKLISKSLKFYLMQKYGVRVVNGKEEKDIKEDIISRSVPFPYTDGVYFFRDTLGSLDVSRKSLVPIRFAGHGSYSLKGETLSVKYQIYDRDTGKNAAEFKVTSSGRGYLGNVTIRLSQKIIAALPVSGRTIKIKSNSVFINLGGRDGVKAKQKIVFEKNGKIFGEGTIERLDSLVSEVVPSFSNWQSVLSVGDSVVPK